MAPMTMRRSIVFSRATASAICRSSSLFALTAIFSLGFPSIRLSSSVRTFHRGRVALQRRPDQLVGQNQAGLTDRSHRQPHVRLSRSVGKPDAGLVIAHPKEHASEATPAVHGLVHLD